MRSGYNKKEALNDIPVIDCWKSDNRKEFLSVVCFALRCFEHSWDFTSAIHNTIQNTEDKHLAGILAGGIADAMYGCKCMTIKEKYAKDRNFKYLSFPKNIESLFCDHIEKIKFYEESIRAFFTKNHALTNVEQHI